MPPPDHAGLALSRRALGAAALGGTGLLVLGGCTDDGVELPGLPTPDPGPDAAAVRAALRVEERMVDALRQAQRQHAALRGRLRATARVHQTHVDLLRPAVEEPALPARGPALPGSAAAAMRTLVEREAASGRAHLRALVGVESGLLARLLAGMAAASAQQARALAEVRPR